MFHGTQLIHTNKPLHMKRINDTKSIGDLLPSFKPMAAATHTNTDKAGITDINNEGKMMVEPKERCRFDMFVRVKKDHHFKFPGGKKEFTIRGDKYDKEDTIKMLKFLLNTVKNHYKQYLLVELYDNATLVKNDDGVYVKTDETLILKLVNGEPKCNRLIRHYTEAIKDYCLPEYLSYEI